MQRRTCPSVRRIKLESKKEQETEGNINFLDLDGVFVAIGTTPNSQSVPDSIKDPYGAVIAGEDCRTSIAGVFAAGDIRTKPLRQIVTAASDGAVSAHMAQLYLAGLNFIE